MTSKFQILAAALKFVPNRADRFAMMVGEWDEAMWDHEKLHRSDPQAANTITSVLQNFLIDGSITDLQNRWAPLRSFTQEFDPSAFSPLSPGVLKHITAGSTAQTNPTNYESGNSTVAPITTTPNEYSVSWQISNIDLNSGVRMRDLVTKNTANFANAVIEAAVVPLTAANFGPPTVIGAASFGFSDLAGLQASLKKSPIKNLILDGTYLARIANQPGFFQVTGTLGGSPRAWQAYGWDLITQNTDWNGADPRVQGFACNPQAIGSLWGIPLLPPIPGNILENETIKLDGLESRVLFESWFNPATRTLWQSLRTIASFTAVDLTAGYLITSS